MSKFSKQDFCVLLKLDYFVIKDTGSLTQFRSVACREYTLPRDDPSSQEKNRLKET